MRRIPTIKIEEEKSLKSVPPVDLFLTDYEIVIEIQGHCHYLGGDERFKNGSTLLKEALLKKLGYEIIEVPIYQLDNLVPEGAVIDTIIDKIRARSVNNDSVSGKTRKHKATEYHTGEYFLVSGRRRLQMEASDTEEEYFSAAEDLQSDDECFFDAVNASI